MSRRYLLLASVLKQHSGFAFVSPPLLSHRRCRPSSGTRIQRYSQRSLSTSTALSLKSSNMGSTSEKGDNYNLAQDSSELFDLYPAPPCTSHYNTIITSDWGESYFPYPKPIGQTKKRGLVHRDGDWHRSVQVWIAQRDKQTNNVRVLLQRRSPYKDTHPNQLDVSCAGHVNAGDDILDTTMRELEEELGGTGIIQQRYSMEDIKRSFTVASSIEGSTKNFGKFICREYQDVFILWWESDDNDKPMDVSMFAPLVEEEVSGFEIVDARGMIDRLRQNDEELVPRSIQYVDALAKAFSCE